MIRIVADPENIPGCPSDSMKPDDAHDLLAHMKQRKLCNPGPLPKCFSCSEEAVTTVRNKLKKMIETLIKGHFLLLLCSQHIEQEKKGCVKHLF